MLNRIWSGLPALTLPFAARMASRKEIKPSAPLSMSRASIDEVSPSLMSLAVSTTTKWSATGSIMTSKVRSVVFTPSDTLKVMVTGPPYASIGGVTTTVRFAPVPARTRLALGMRN